MGLRGWGAGVTAEGGGLTSGCPLCQSFPAPLGRHPSLRPAPCQATAHFLPPGLQGRLPRGETKVRASPCRFPGKPRLSPGLPGHARGCAGPRQRWGRGIFPLTVWQASAACDEAQPTQQWPPLIPLIPQPPGSGRPPPPPSALCLSRRSPVSAPTWQASVGCPSEAGVPFPGWGPLRRGQAAAAFGVTGS